MSRSMAAILGGILGGTIMSALLIIVAYLIVGSLSWGVVIPAVFSGVVFAILYPLTVTKGRR